MSQTIISSLKSQNAFLQAEAERFATAVDHLSQQLAAALNRLNPHDPEFVAAMMGNEPGEKVPAVLGDGDTAE